ncbi:hypothetical protein PRIPAC_76163 [Pristionchus pacificus]|uniref:C2H2-type domain-containing protein n=1 Tax=Pristionchus pacificus TaxID=54126 RepID=A0A2A6C6T6_PRIPA|nr:hypothetical protein PRIPAC_76163 [Pristionchus pacificus]|eukprot:PDM73895.1 hypothetical protein PRIPAC_41251 [Pristionchus pacificus]
MAAMLLVACDIIEYACAFQSIGYSVESLKRERDLAMSRDGQRFDPLRNMLYGLSESLGTLMDSVLEDRRREALHQGQLQSQSHPQQPLQLLQLMPQEQHEEWTNDSSDTEDPVLRTMKAEVEDSPDVVILADQPGSSKHTQSVHPKTRPPSVPPLKIRRISRDQASSFSPVAKVDANQPARTSVVQSTTQQSAAAFPQPPANSALTDPVASAEMPARNENRWKRSCAPASSGFYTEEDEEAAAAAAQPAAQYGCHECDRLFDSKQGIKRHAFTHRAVHCPTCNKFVAKEKLGQHITEYHK